MIGLASPGCFWLLLLACGSVGSVTTGEAGNTVTARLTTQETPGVSSNGTVGPLLPDQNVTRSTTVGDQPKGTTVKPGTSSKTVFTGSPKGATSNIGSVTSNNTQTEAGPTVPPSPTTVNQSSKATTILRVPSTTRTSNQSETSQKATASQSTTHGAIRPTTLPQSTTRVASATTSSKLADSTTSDVTSTTLYKSTTPKQTTRAIKNKDKERQQKPQGKESQDSAKHGKIVAGLIGGALLLMMVGFLVIFIKKRKLQRQQTLASDWAGPSPFIEAGSNSEQPVLRSLHQISMSSFLPQRLSKRWSLFPETDEELKVMTSGNTFGDDKLSGQKAEGNGVQESNVSSAADPDDGNKLE